MKYYQQSSGLVASLMDITLYACEALSELCRPCYKGAGNLSVFNKEYIKSKLSLTPDKTYNRYYRLENLYALLPLLPFLGITLNLTEF